MKAIYTPKHAKIVVLLRIHQLTNSSPKIAFLDKLFYFKLKITLLDTTGHGRHSYFSTPMFIFNRNIKVSFLGRFRGFHKIKLKNIPVKSISSKS